MEPQAPTNPAMGRGAPTICLHRALEELVEGRGTVLGKRGFF